MVEKDHFGKRFPNEKKGDLHVHSGYSYKGISLDGKLQPHELVEKAESLRHEILAITDHDTIVPSIVGREFAEKEGYRVEVIVGKEVSSLDGHILALGIETNIPFWMSAQDTVRAIHAQGGLAIPAHPLFMLTDSVGRRKLRDIAQDPDSEVYWDGIEVFNAGANDWRGVEWFTKFSDGNRMARNFYTKENENGDYGAPIGGSDTHGESIGRAVTAIPQSVTIYDAIRKGETGVIMMDKRENHSIQSMRETQRKSIELEQYRRTFPTEARIFPMR